MNCDDSCQKSIFKIRYKAIENFLRKIAFNLGNTPSQTDVKIISCIPVDVSDLQQKISYLENQLRNFKNPITVEAYNNDFISYPAAVFNNPFLNQTSPNKNNAKTTVDNLIQNVKLTKINTRNSNKTKRNVYEKDGNGKLIQSSMTIQNRSNNKKIKDNYDAKLSFKKDSGVVYNSTNNIQIIEKTKPQCGWSVIDTTDYATQLSGPICRDLSNFNNSVEINNTEHFTNIDDNLRKHNNFYFDNKDIYSQIKKYNNKAYDDDSQYDVIPVRERPKVKYIDIEHDKKVDALYRNMEMLCYPENVKIKNKHAEDINIVHVESHKILHGSNSFSCYIDYGKIYAKHPTERENDQVTSDNNKYIQKQAVVNDDKTLQANNSYRIKSNTECLAEIKSILQNVLFEIKENTKNKSVGYTNTVTSRGKDATVKHTSDKSNLTANTSFWNGNRFNTNSYMPNYNSNIYPMFPYQPLGYMPPMMMPPAQNYPNFFKNYNKNNLTTKHHDTKTTKETNTTAEKVGEETEKLIKEIYKCVTLNVDSTESRAMDDNNPNERHEQDDKTFNKDIQAYNSCTKTNKGIKSEDEYIHKLKPKEFNVASLSNVDKMTEVDKSEVGESSSLEDSSVSATTVTISTVTPTKYKKKKKDNLFAKMIKSVKKLKGKKAIKNVRTKKITFEGIDDTESESDESKYSDENPVYNDMKRKPFPPNMIKIEKKPRTPVRFQYLEKDYRQWASQPARYPRRPDYAQHYDARPVFVDRAQGNHYEVKKPFFTNANKPVTRIQKCGQNWKNIVWNS